MKYKFMVFDETTVKRFWSKVDKRGDKECWPWKAARAGKNYGTLNAGGKSYYAHRFVLMITGQMPPHDRSVSTHSCDNPCCCNPRHLSWGTHKSNSLEARDRKRIRSLKLCESQVAYIKVLLLNDYLAREIASWYGVTTMLIYHIQHKRAWANVSPAEIITT